MAVILTNQVQADPGVSEGVNGPLTPRLPPCRRNILVSLTIRFAAASSAKPVGGELHTVYYADKQATSSHTRTCMLPAFPNNSSATRIQLRKGRGDERIAKLQDSPDMPEGEATYCLKSG